MTECYGDCFQYCQNEDCPEVEGCRQKWNEINALREMGNDFPAVSLVWGIAVSGSVILGAVGLVLIVVLFNLGLIP